MIPSYTSAIVLLVLGGIIGLCIGWYGAIAAGKVV